MTVRETLLPAAMVPGLVTVEDSKGNQRNVFPIDAKEMISSGDYELVENGAVEAARMAATPLRSGMAAGIPSDQIVAEVSGIAGMVVAHDDPKKAEEVRSNSAGIDGTDEPDEKVAKTASTQDADNAKKSAALPKTDAEKASQSQGSGNDQKSGDAKK